MGIPPTCGYFLTVSPMRHAHAPGDETPRNGYGYESSLNRWVMANESSDHLALHWAPSEGHRFELSMHHTVYRPDVDTNLLAQTLLEWPIHGSGRLLEIGCGSGAIALLASSLGWEVTACDLNAHAIESTNRNALDHGLKVRTYLGGPVRVEGTSRPSSWLTEGYDLVVWNTPYLDPLSDNPLDAMIDLAFTSPTPPLDLLMPFADEMLSPEGRLILIVGEADHRRKEALGWIRHGWACRTLLQHQFEDGEVIEARVHWRPFEQGRHRHVEEVPSTNSALHDDPDAGPGDRLSAVRQTHGRGRRGRQWKTTEGAVAASWMLPEHPFAPGRLQVELGLAVRDALRSLDSSRTLGLDMKWPNDVLLGGDKVAGILVEQRVLGHQVRTVAGIGVNLRNVTLEGIRYVGLDWNLEATDVIEVIHAAIASRLEGIHLTPLADSDRHAIEQTLETCGPMVAGRLLEHPSVDDEGRLIGTMEGSTHVCTDLDEVTWRHHYHRG